MYGAQDIDRVPAVHVRRVVHVTFEDALPPPFIGAIQPSDEDDQRSQALLVERAVQQLGNILQGEGRVAPYDGAHPKG